MWRKRNEGNLPQLAGADDYDKQVPLARAIPLWDGPAGNGFAPILWHRSKKTNKEECSQAVRDGKITQALRSLNPTNKRGSWAILYDDESFIRAKISMAAY